MFMYPTPFPTVIDAIIKALETALPGRVPGGHFGTHTGVRFYGRRPNGSFFDTHDSGHGGWGACSTHDGAGPFRTMAHGDTRIIPLELQESLMPFRLEEFSLREDCGGAGKFRGGMGFRKRYRITGPAMLGTNLDRTKFPPWGVQGGKEAQPGRIAVRKASTGKEELREKENAFELEAGDLVTVETGGGGGYGPPSERDIAAIQRDLDAGYITSAAAERDYGVKVGPDGIARR
jgi:N-methylhydantoinase B